MEIDPVPMALNLYVTNKTQGVEHLFVRVQGDKLKEHEMYDRILGERSVGLSGEAASGKAGLNVFVKNEKEERKRQVFDCLKQGGFNLLPLNEPTPFALENTRKDMNIAYISVYDEYASWSTDMPVHPDTFCCVTVKGDRQNGINIRPFNPKPRWIQENRKDVDVSLPSQGLVVVHSRRSPTVSVYLGKITYSTANLPPVIQGSFLCGVRYESGKRSCFTNVPPHENVREVFGREGTVVSVDVLANPGYEWVKAQRGNTIPPNAVKTSVYRSNGRFLAFLRSKKREEWYLGRISSDTVCGITEVEGMIDYFVPNQGFPAGGEVENFKSTLSRNCQEKATFKFYACFAPSYSPEQMAEMTENDLMAGEWLFTA
ncbi:hypothetical protein ACROYT_G021686 [Oculina patagonica]